MATESSYPALPARLFDMLRAAGVDSFELQFQGGSDEGNLDINIRPDWAHSSETEKLVRDWAWSVFEFSGAGDGTDFGEDYVYDLVNQKVTLTEWNMERKDQEPVEDFLDVTGQRRAKAVQPEPELPPQSIQEFLFTTLSNNPPTSSSETPEQWWKRVRGVPVFDELTPEQQQLVKLTLDYHASH